MLYILCVAKQYKDEQVLDINFGLGQNLENQTLAKGYIWLVTVL